RSTDSGHWTAARLTDKLICPRNCTEEFGESEAVTRALEHDPEKWTPVFGKACPRARPEGSCFTNKLERDDVSKKSHLAREGRTFTTIERWTMYRHILIPTDGSELAEHAVTNGLSLAKSVGAKVTVIIVQEPFDLLSVPETRSSQRQALENFAKHNEQIEKRASVLSRVADAAKQAGVPCDTMQV